MASKTVFTALSGVVQTKSGWVSLSRGDELPSDLVSGEKDRLDTIGVLGQIDEDAPASIADDPSRVAEAQRLGEDPTAALPAAVAPEEERAKVDEGFKPGKTDQGTDHPEPEQPAES